MEFIELSLVEVSLIITALYEFLYSKIWWFSEQLHDNTFNRPSPVNRQIANTLAVLFYTLTY